MTTKPTETAIKIDRLIGAAYNEGFRLHQERKTTGVNTIAPLWNGVTVCMLSRGAHFKQSVVKDGVVVYSFSEVIPEGQTTADENVYAELVKRAEHHVTH